MFRAYGIPPLESSMFACACSVLAATLALRPPTALLPSAAATHPLLRVGVEAAYAAGVHLLDSVGSAEVKARKLDRADLVTAVDGECQEIIEARIRALEGVHSILGEESVPPGADAAVAALQERLGPAATDGEWLWIIDPIDGTTNFVAGLPLCAVSIGITDARSGARMGAVVLDPFRDECFTAWRGAGAWLNGEPMRCSEVSDLADAVVCGCSPKLHAVSSALRGLAVLMPQVRSIRILGSGVLNFAWVACGRLSAYWEPELAPWDTAAGTLLIEEAGGAVTDLDGSPYTLATRAVLGSASGVHTALLGALEEADALTAD